MHDDRELLEMAAKAAGYDVVWNEHWKCFQHRNQSPDKFGNVRHPWVPLDDDGDALRLAVELRLDIRFLDGFKQVSCFRGAFGDAMHLHGLVGYGGGADREPSAENVRRAIVRVAAAIGEAMQ